MPTSFLHRTAVSAADLTRQGQANEKLAAALARELERPIGNAFRTEVEGPSDAWLDDAFHAAGTLLRDEPAIQALAKQGSAEAKRLKAFLDEALSKEAPGPAGARQRDGLRGDIRTAAANLARHIVILWIDELARAPRKSGQPLLLNADMLPGKVSAREIVEKIDLAEFAIGREEATGSWAACRQEMTQRALEAKQPIVLGPNHCVYPDSDLQRGEYRVFEDAAGARRFIKEEQERMKNARLPPRDVLEPMFSRAYGDVCEAAFGERPRMDARELERLFVLEMKRRRGNQGKHAAAMKKYKRTGARPAVFVDDMASMATHMATTMVTAMKRGFIGGRKRAEAYIVNEKEAYAERIRHIAEVANVTPGDACQAIGYGMVAAFRAGGLGKPAADAKGPRWAQVKEDPDKKALNDLAIATMLCARQSMSAS